MTRSAPSWYALRYAFTWATCHTLLSSKTSLWMALLETVPFMKWAETHNTRLGAWLEIRLSPRPCSTSSKNACLGCAMHGCCVLPACFYQNETLPWRPGRKWHKKCWCDMLEGGTQDIQFPGWILECPGNVLSSSSKMWGKNWDPETPAVVWSCAAETLGARWSHMTRNHKH